MKKIRWISLILTFIILVSISACQGKEKPENKPEKKEAKITVDYYEGGKDSKDVISFTEPRYENDEYLTKLIISTDQIIKNVKLIDVETGHVDDKITKFYIKDVVYELDELTPEKPLVFGTVFPNFMANHVISYEDTTGKEKIFSISMSGEDGSIKLNPAEFEDETNLKDNANVVMSFVDRDISSEYPGYYDYYDDIYNNPEYQMNILITTDQTISEVKIFSAQMGTVTDLGTGFYVENLLYELDELYPDTPLLYVTEFPGDMPTRIISYIDTNGEEKVYSLSMSGNDGSLVAASAFIEGENNNQYAEDEAYDKQNYENSFVYIGYEAQGYDNYPVYIDGEITPEKLINEIAKITGWNLDLADEVTSGKGGMTVNFSSESSIAVGPPENQKDEFRAYDVYSFTKMVLDSIKTTLQQNYVMPPGNPDNLDVYFALENNNIIMDDVSIPIEEPWDSNRY